MHNFLCVESFEGVGPSDQAHAGPRCHASSMTSACASQVGDSKPGFYAIASPPDPNNAGLVELLIKSVPGTTAEILAGSSAGGTTRTSTVHTEHGTGSTQDRPGVHCNTVRRRHLASCCVRPQHSCLATVKAMQAVLPDRWVAAGDAVDVSPVMGKGFNLAAVPVEEVPTLLLFATGSGIAPIRALIDSERLQVPRSM